MIIKQLRISEDARADLLAIQDYIKPKDEAAAARVISAILTTASLLESFPLMGRVGRVAKTREFSVPGTPYFIVYTLPDEIHVDLEAVLHERLKYPFDE